MVKVIYNDEETYMDINDWIKEGITEDAKLSFYNKWFYSYPEKKYYNFNQIRNQVWVKKDNIKQLNKW